MSAATKPRHVPPPFQLDTPDGDRWTEVWDGVTVMPTLPNDEHQEIQTNLLLPLVTVVGLPGLGKVRAGVNVTDRHPDWKQNYRCPDIVVYLNSNRAVNHGSHWVGGPDFVVEIVSAGEDPRAKPGFYAAVGTREVLLVDRDPWALELYRLDGGVLAPVGRSTPDQTAGLESTALPLTFTLRPCDPRPIISVTHPATGQTWAV